MIKSALLLFLCFTSLAASKKEDTSQSKEMVEIAQNLILQKDRDQAIRLLSKALQSEKSKTMQNEIRSILKDIGSLFLYDKSQQEYESSINFKKTDPTKWLASVEKAQKIEPDNTLIMMEVVRSWLNKKNLEKAKEAWDESRVKNPYDRNVIITSAFLSLVSGDSKEIHSSRAKLKDLQLSNYSQIANYLNFLEKVASGNRDKAFSGLPAVKKEDPLNPQILYWENRLAPMGAAEGLLAANSKADDDSVCSVFPETYFRRYQYDLLFCSTALEYFFKIKDPQ